MHLEILKWAIWEMRMIYIVETYKSKIKPALLLLVYFIFFTFLWNKTDINLTSQYHSERCHGWFLCFQIPHWACPTGYTDVRSVARGAGTDTGEWSTYSDPQRRPGWNLLLGLARDIAFLTTVSKCQRNASVKCRGILFRLAVQLHLLFLRLTRAFKVLIA